MGTDGVEIGIGKAIMPYGGSAWSGCQRCCKTLGSGFRVSSFKKTSITNSRCIAYLRG
jgi:hypothetical protein